MNELIKLSKQTVNNKVVSVVNAKDLYKFLEAEDKFYTWLDYELFSHFKENVDYIVRKKFNKKTKRNIKNYYLTVNCAKRLTISYETEQGEKAYVYFSNYDKKLNPQVDLILGTNLTLKQACFLAIIEACSQEELLLSLNKLNNEIIIPLENKIEERTEQVPYKKDYYDIVLEHKGCVTTEELANDFGMSVKEFNTILFEENIQYKHDSGVWMLQTRYLVNQYAHTGVYETEKGAHRAKLYLKWTQKGRLFIYNLFKRKRGILPRCEQE